MNAFELLWLRFFTKVYMYVVFDSSKSKLGFCFCFDIFPDSFFPVKMQRNFSLTQKNSRNLYVTSIVICTNDIFEILVLTLFIICVVA